MGWSANNFVTPAQATNGETNLPLTRDSESRVEGAGDDRGHIMTYSRILSRMWSNTRRLVTRPCWQPNSRRRRALFSQRDDFESHITVAKKLINLRDFPAASNHIERALQLDSRSTEAFNLAGVLAEMMEDYDRAKRLYGQAIKINKRYAPAQQNMRRIFELFNFGSSEEPFNLGNK
jgi:tetratricopeptide (TPR) repeat protein